MNWNLIRQEKEEKILVQVFIYKETHSRLHEISKAEGVKVTDIVRHAINDMLESYAAQKPAQKPGKIEC